MQAQEFSQKKKKIDMPIKKLLLKFGCQCPPPPQWILLVKKTWPVFDFQLKLNIN